MPSILTQLTDRLIAPAVERRLAAEPVEKATQAFAVGVQVAPTPTLKYPDADHDLPYAVY